MAQQWTAQGGGPHILGEAASSAIHNSKRGESSRERIGADLSRRALVGNGHEVKGLHVMRGSKLRHATTATAAKAAERHERRPTRLGGAAIRGGRAAAIARRAHARARGTPRGRRQQGRT